MKFGYCHRNTHGPGMDEPIVTYEGSVTTDRRFLSSDERGSIISVTDSSGALLGINRYDEYGNPQSTNIGTWGYTGQAWLPSVGVWYYKARDYDPELGRFLQTDPIDILGGINLYAYVGNDPVNWTDPLGLRPCAVYPVDEEGHPEEGADTGASECGDGWNGGGLLYLPRLGDGAGDPSGGFPPCKNAFICKDPAVTPSKECNVVNNYCRSVPPVPLQCPRSPTPPASKSYPVPPGYTTAHIRNNLYVRDSSGQLAMNPLYEKAFRSSGGVNWQGVGKDLTKITLNSVWSGRAAVTSVFTALGLPVSSEIKTLAELAQECSR